MQETMQSARLLMHALWGTALHVVAMKAADDAAAAPVSSMPARPVLDRQAALSPTLHLPSVKDTGRGARYRAIHAAAAHAVAHLHFSSGSPDDAAIKPLHQAILGVFEDTRVEHLAMEALPGLRRLWQPFHDELATDDATLDALFRRLACALFDPMRKDDHPWVQKGRCLYSSACGAGWQEMRRAASILANDIGQMRMRYDAGTCQVQPAYRDDNTHLWRMPEGKAIASPQDIDQAASGKEASDSFGAGSPMESEAREMRPLGTVPEWDRLISRHRPDWCGLFEMRPQEGNPAMISEQLERHAAWIRAMAIRIRRRTALRTKPMRGNAGGDFDEAALVDAAIALRAGGSPRTDIHLDAAMVPTRRHVVFILDASVSTGCACPSWLGLSDCRLLDGMALATVLAGAAFERAGHDCTILAFSSNTRRCVRIHPIKNEGEPATSPTTLARLAGLAVEWSTRSGAAVRHATRLMHGVPGALVVLVTDGRPHDVDIHDPRYLLEDLQHAEQEARRQGVQVLNLELTTGNDARMTGQRSPNPPCMQVSNLSMLAEALLRPFR
jgi:hypothetical protein